MGLTRFVTAAVESIRSFVGGNYFLATAFSRPTLAGANVSPQSALTCMAVWRAVNLYSNAMRLADFYVAELLPNGGHRRAIEHPTFAKVHRRANTYMSAGNLLSSLMLQSQTKGVGYAEIVRNGWTGEVDSLHLIDPANCDPFFDAQKRLWYRLKAEGKDIPPRDMLVVGTLAWDGITPISPIEVGLEEVGTSIAKGQYESTLYGNSARISGHYEFPGALSKPQKDVLMQEHTDKHGGPQRANRPAILSGGVKWVQDQFSPADTDLILSRGFSVEEVGRMYDLNAWWLGKRDGTPPPLEDLLTELYTFSLLPRFHQFEQECNHKLFRACDRDLFEVRHSNRQFLRGNLAATAARNLQMFNMGCYSQNDILEREGENPIDTPSANKHWVPVNNLASIEDMDSRSPRPAVEDDPDLETRSMAPEAPGPTCADMRQNDALDQALADPLGRMFRRESLALQKLRLGDLGPFDRLQRLSDFYAEHRPLLRESLAPAAGLASVVLHRSIDVDAVTDSIIGQHREQLANAVAMGGPAMDQFFRDLYTKQAAQWAAKIRSSFDDPEV